MELKAEIIHRLSSRGVLAYVAVSLAAGTEATTAALAGLVKAQTAVIREGLQELAVEAPEAVQPASRGKWKCGGESGGVQILDSERYRTLVDDLSKYWMFLNPDVVFPFAAAEGVAVRQFLRENPGWLQEDWQRALQNRARSVRLHGHASRTEGFRSWIRRLGDYSGGPLDRWNKPVEGGGKHGQTVATEQGNRSAVEAYLSNSHAGAGA